MRFLCLHGLGCNADVCCSFFLLSSFFILPLVLSISLCLPLSFSLSLWSPFCSLDPSFFSSFPFPLCARFSQSISSIPFPPPFASFISPARYGKHILTLPQIFEAQTGKRYLCPPSPVHQRGHPLLHQGETLTVQRHTY